MRKVRVKICGITRKKDLLIAANAGADAVGFVVGVSASPRNLSLTTAKKLMQQAPLFVTRVLVTIPKTLENLQKMCDTLKPDVVQIHGNNTLNITAIRETFHDLSLIRALNVKSVTGIEISRKTAQNVDALLLDSYTEGLYGGTGVVHDWAISKRVKEMIHPTPLILAGGLKPENVGDAVQIVQPYSVDVSSGVERQPGIKDPAKIVAFITNAQEVEI